MSEMRQASEESLERPLAYGMGQGRERVLMELFVLTESGKLVGVFSTRGRLLDQIASCPYTFEFEQSPDGIKTIERACDYRTQRVLLDRVLTDA